MIDTLRRDEATTRMLAGFRKQRQYTERMGFAEHRERSYQELADEMLANFNANEARAINSDA